MGEWVGFLQKEFVPLEPNVWIKTRAQLVVGGGRGPREWGGGARQMVRLTEGVSQQQKYGNTTQRTRQKRHQKDLVRSRGRRETLAVYGCQTFRPHLLADTGHSVYCQHRID